MIGNRKVLALIPARGGSKGLPGKNVLRVNGRPLIAWTIDAAQRARSIDRVILSSDDDRIIAAARECGCEVPYRRPAALASDTTPMIDVVLHALDELPGYEIIVLLQPTSPLRTAEDIDAACEKLMLRGAPSCVSICVSSQSPHWMYFMNQDQTLRPVIDEPHGFVRRQELPAAYVLNGAIYVADVAWLRRTRKFTSNETIAYLMPAERSIDIDTPADFEAFKNAVTEEFHV